MRSSRVNDHSAIACAFDLLMFDGDDLRRKPFAERKAALRKVLRRIQYIEHVEGDGAEMALRGSSRNGSMRRIVPARPNLGSRPRIRRPRRRRAFSTGHSDSECATAPSAIVGIAHRMDRSYFAQFSLGTRQ
jgi:hypothetical protein